MVSVPRRTTPARRLRTPAAAVATALAAGVLATACTAPATPSAEPEDEPTSTPLSAYDADPPPVTPRGPCTGIAAATLDDALGGDVAASLSWAPGQRLPGTSEVADEHGCRYTAEDVTASAWVFAVPTSPAQARRLVQEVTGQQECRPVRDVETFGDPGVAFSCDRRRGAPLTGMRALVSPWWVSCEIRGTDDVERVGRWCAAVLGSLSAS